MTHFTCDGRYTADLKTYTETVLERFGIASQSAEREIMSLADSGNTVALKLYGDMIFYKKLLRHHPYREAFDLYMRAAGLTPAVFGSDAKAASWTSDGAAYPLAFWDVAYYLVHYRRDSFLKECEAIAAIDALPLTERLGLALKLAVSCIDYVNAAEAINLVGLILKEASDDEALFAELKPVIAETVEGREFPEISLKIGRCETADDCSSAAALFFITAAKEGYAYACNSLAAREADRIIAMNAGQTPGSSASEELKEAIETYLTYLKLSADKYEPYACNRLGLFYMTGEIRGTSGKTCCRDYVNTSLAKEYFTRATIYPDANSAWAFLNLIQFFQKDYDCDIELMNEHMDYIKALNPEVYNIAMDL